MSAKLTKCNRKAFSGWVFTKDGDFYHDPNGHLDVPAQQRNVDTLHKLRILRRTFVVTKNVDESLVKQATAASNRAALQAPNGALGWIF